MSPPWANGGLLVRGGVDHAAPPMAEVLAGAGAEPARVRRGGVEREAGVEPAEAAGLAAADGAEGMGRTS